MKKLSSRGQMTWKLTAICPHTAAFNNEHNPYSYSAIKGSEMANVKTIPTRKLSA